MDLELMFIDVVIGVQLAIILTMIFWVVVIIIFFNCKRALEKNKYILVKHN